MFAKSASGRITGFTASALILLSFTPLALASDPMVQMPAAVVTLDRQIDWSHAGLIAVQDNGRYKTLDSFARESMSVMTGSEHLPGLSPIGSLLEWMFNRDAYLDHPVIRVKEQGLRIHFTAHMPEAQRIRIRQSGFMTLREFNDPVVRQRMAELEPRFEMVSAIRKVRNAQAVAMMLEDLARIVPAIGKDSEAMWLTPKDLVPNLGLSPEQVGNASMSGAGAPVPGVTSEQAMSVVLPWSSLRAAWLERNPQKVQQYLGQLATVLPALASPGVYPTESQRRAETQYYAFGKFIWGYTLYMFGLIISVWALVTRWKFPWYFGLVLLVAALSVHAYGLSLRWYILGRIPVANMFEAIVASAWIGIAVALLVELIYRTRVFMLGAHATGFFALVLAGYVLPGGGTITTIMGILDDVMLRIHTVLIIASYALIFLASMIAVVYLFGYYLHQHPYRSIESSLLTALGGGVMLVAAGLGTFVTAANASGISHAPWAMATFGGLAGAGLVGLTLLDWVPRAFRTLYGTAMVVALLVGGTVAFTPYDFVIGLGKVFVVGGLAWAIATGIGIWMTRPAPAASAGPAMAMALPGMGEMRLSAIELNEMRPILSGAMPGDESQGAKLPAWLHHFDWSHLIILNLVFVVLFVGIILGAVWADYSWGRPWGWDPKEVFAMNTWIIYAILIHTRFFVKNKGLWTAWLSVIGCLMMAFNWAVVNFFIVGLHSYA